MRRSLLFALSLSLLTVSGCLVYAGEPEPPGWQPGVEVELSFFYDALSPYGDWLWVEPWGRVWTPWDVEPGWRPYTHGRWVYTHLGWTWIAEEVWGWAPYHYGRWTYDPFYGWIWIPDTVWAPSWVAWRHGPGWIGWAPLPPRARWVVGVGLDLDGLDLDLVLEEHWGSFVPERDFLAPRVWHRLSPPPRNGFHLRETRDVTRYEERAHHVAVHGIDVDELERRIGRVERHVLEDLDRPPRRAEAVEREAVRVYRPEVREEPGGEARRTRPAPPPDAGEPPSPAVERELRRRQEREDRDLAAWEEAQRRALERLQREERRKPPRETSEEAIRERQDEERRALEREVKRQKDVLRNRREREEKEPPKTRRAVPRKPPPGR